LTGIKFSAVTKENSVKCSSKQKRKRRRQWQQTKKYLKPVFITIWHVPEGM
jgi:hypothetical protein